FVINTHFHGDHTGGNSQFGPEATIIAHENVRKRLKDGGPPPGGAKPAPKEALPIVTFNDKTTVHVNGEDIRAIHFPHGHTDGDSVIFFTKAIVVQRGDVFVPYVFLFGDVKGGGSIRGMTAGDKKVLGMVQRNTKITPGQGPLSPPADLRKFI